MQTTKMRPCCARVTAKLTMDKAQLARLAGKAALTEARNHDASRLKAAIADVKQMIAEDKQKIDDHEADHAGEVAL